MSDSGMGHQKDWSGGMSHLPVRVSAVVCGSHGARAKTGIPVCVGEVAASSRLCSCTGMVQPSQCH